MPRKFKRGDIVQRLPQYRFGGGVALVLGPPQHEHQGNGYFRGTWICPPLDWERYREDDGTWELCAEFFSKLEVPDSSRAM